MAKYQLIFEDDERGCVSCPYSYYYDGDDESSKECGFYCSKYKRYIGQYENNHGLVTIPDWCVTVKKVIE